MTRFNVNTSYFQHSTPEYNRKHQEENSEYNHEYYETHKEKWADNDSDEKSKSGSESEEEKKDSKDKKEKESKEKKMPVLNGGSKKGGSPTGKKSSKKSSTEKSKEKKNETEEDKEKEEQAKKEAEEAEERNKNTEYVEQLKQLHKTWSPENLKNAQKLIEEQKKKNKNKTVKHSAVYVGINSQPYFEHHGRLGMKWGKRNGPPYPLDYSKLSEEERAKDKTRVKEEGDIESVAYKKNRSYFSDQEINEVINRYQLNQRINQLSADSAKMKAGKSKTEQLVDNMAKVADVGNKLSNALNAGTNVYNNVAKIMNAFGDSDMPIIGQAKQEKKKEFKATKKELDKLIENLETGMGNMTNQELQDALKRKTMFDSLTKDRDTKRAAEKEEADAKTAKAQEEYSRINSGTYRKASNFVKDNDVIVEHVTGEVVDSGRDFANLLLLEDKQRR